MPDFKPEKENYTNHFVKEKMLINKIIRIIKFWMNLLQISMETIMIYNKNYKCSYMLSRFANVIFQV